MTDTQPREAQLSREAPNREDEARFRQIFCGDIDIRIARDGTWYHEGSPITRKPLVKLFAGILRREPDGEYYLVTPAEKRRIRVDDAPFVAVYVTASGEGTAQQLTFRTNVDDEVTAGADHPIRVAFDEATAEPAPYVEIRPGLEALIARAVYYELVGMGETAQRDGMDVLGVWSGGEFFTLGMLDDDA